MSNLKAAVWYTVYSCDSVSVLPVHMHQPMRSKLRTLQTTCLLFLSLTALLVFLPSCSRQSSYKYKIGVSQCVGGPWRDKVNNEMLSAQHLYDTDVKVSIANADNNTAVQRRQIDSLIQSGVDLLIISPNEYKPLSPCVEKAKRQGIPVILFERKTSSNDYTAYIGGDNTEAGRAIGRYAA